MFSQLYQKLVNLVNCKEDYDQNSVEINDDWFIIEQNFDLIIHECAGGLEEPPEQDPIESEYNDTIKVLLDHLLPEQEVDDSEYEIIE